ncbi:hypothetical protein GA0115247_132043, partial [Streptomyces sp. PalvLS-984]
MDAQGRGRDEGIDPADQWVLNPDTGDYELRLTPSAGRAPSASGSPSAAPSSSGASATRAATPSSRREEAPGTPPADERAAVPGQRGGRRGAGRSESPSERGPGGRAGAR